MFIEATFLTVQSVNNQMVLMSTMAWFFKFCPKITQYVLPFTWTVNINLVFTIYNQGNDFSWYIEKQNAKRFHNIWVKSWNFGHSATSCRPCHDKLSRRMLDKTSELKPKTLTLDTVQDFLILLGIKPHMHLMEIGIFSLYHVIVKPTKIMNRANKNWAHFL